MRRFSALSLAGLLATFVVGCQHDASTQGNQPTVGSSQIVVPKDAKLVAFGPFPGPPFVLPSGGTLYVLDQDAGRVALVTSFPTNAASGTQPIDLGKLPNPDKLLDLKHHYAIYFVGDHSTARATYTPTEQQTIREKSRSTRP